MYKKVEGGRLEVIQGIECWIPPEGYGIDRITGELKHIGVVSRSPKKSEQYWERLQLPADYNKKRKKEEARIKEDPEYYDPELEAVREKHWTYRRCGYWFMNNGVATYITGTHWLYLNWGVTNIGYMRYRDTDRKVFYAIRSVEEDPRAGGLVYVSRRRGGKTYIATIWMYDRVTLGLDKIGGIQSKTDLDASAVFKKIVNYFVNMPHFFRPTYDQTKGLRPNKELRFYKTTKRGKDAEDMLEGDELRSEINFGSSESYHYDGQALYAYILDEFGKPQKADTWETWKVVQYCMDQDGRWVGKAFVTSTIEDLDTTGSAPKEIWYNSDPQVRDANGRTTSGLYRIFIGAHEGTFLEDDHEAIKFGVPNIEKNLAFYNAKRDARKNNTRDLASEIRKNPFTVEEAFRVDADQCLYDSMLLNERLDRLSWKENITTRGNFVWEGGERDTRVVFEPTSTGKWEICYTPDEKDTNKVIKRGGLFYPNNKLFVGGADPIDHTMTQDNRRSNGAGIILRKGVGDGLYDMAFVAKYCYRPDMVSIYYEEMIKVAFYYGCEILFENNKVNMMHYFNERGYGAFLMWLPDRAQAGIAASPRSHQYGAELTEEYIRQYHDRIYFKDLIKEWLLFDINNTTKFDLAMAASYALIAASQKVTKQDREQIREVTDYFRKHKI